MTFNLESVLYGCCMYGNAVTENLGASAIAL